MHHMRLYSCTQSHQKQVKFVLEPPLLINLEMNCTYMSTSFHHRVAGRLFSTSKFAAATNDPQ
jgi:hypothetical protein